MKGTYVIRVGKTRCANEMGRLDGLGRREEQVKGTHELGRRNEQRSGTYELGGRDG